MRISPASPEPSDSEPFFSFDGDGVHAPGGVPASWVEAGDDQPGVPEAERYRRLGRAADAAVFEMPADLFAEAGPALEAVEAGTPSSMPAALAEFDVAVAVASGDELGPPELLWLSADGAAHMAPPDDPDEDFRP